MATTLEEIKKPIASELKEFEKIFRDSMKSKVSLLNHITHYIVHRKGKQVRPMFVFLTAKMVGGINENTYTAASLVELLHTATLVHDDVVDESYMRRGVFSINALWKNKIAVLIGDYLLAKGLLLSINNNQFRLLKILSNTVQEMSEGELLQLEKARRLDIKQEVYFDIITKKTASLIASASAAGAASVSEDEEMVERVRLLGETIGIAFQIKDDLFDYGEKEIGKPRGIDIKERKMTLPLIYALSQANKSEKRKIINIIKNHNEKIDKVREVIHFVQQKGGISYTEQVMQQYRNKAMEQLNTFPAGEARDSLAKLIDFTIERQH